LPKGDGGCEGEIIKDAEIAAIGGGGKTGGRHGDVGEMTGGVGDGERGRIGTRINSRAETAEAAAKENETR
jgi:hypothetical protein